MDNRNRSGGKSGNLSLEKELASLFTDIPVAYAPSSQLKYVYQLDQLFSDEPFNVHADNIIHAIPNDVVNDLQDPPQETSFVDNREPITIDLSAEITEETAVVKVPPQSAKPENGNVAQPNSTTPEQLLQLLKSPHPDNRFAAVQQLVSIQQPWVITPLLESLVDKNLQIVGLALSALLQMYQLTQQQLLTFSQQPPTPRLQQGANIYLSHLLGQPMIHIPVGPFLMGSNPAQDKLADKNEMPQHQLHLAGYWISRYPVTAAQFKAFIRKSGHTPHGDEYMRQPDNHPIVDITWAEALAYCHWLSERTGLTITLPGEAQWEKAARGLDGRRYPWGNIPPSFQHCNFQKVTPVGHFSPQGDSPYGCADMSGNIWEWTCSMFRPYPYRIDDGRELLEGDDTRCVRGSAFINTPKFTRCTFRYKISPHLHLNHLGFRIVMVTE